MVACRYGISLLVCNSTSHSSGALTRELSSETLEEKFYIYTRPCIILYLFESFGGFWGTAPLRQIFRVSHEFGSSRSSYDFRSVYHIDRKDELIKHSVKFLLQRELIGVCIFWCSCHQCNEHSLNALIGSL